MAQHRARVLDPSMLTSVGNTYFMLGQYRRGLEDPDQPLDALRGFMLAMLGREEEAAAALEREAVHAHGTLRQFVAIVQAAIAGDREACKAALDARRLSGFRDPEGYFYMALSPARLGEIDLALEYLGRAVHGGFTCPVPMRHNAWLDAVRHRPEFEALADEAEARHRQCVDAYAAAEGPAVLGVPAKTQS